MADSVINKCEFTNYVHYKAELKTLEQVGANCS